MRHSTKYLTVLVILCIVFGVMYDCEAQDRIPPEIVCKTGIIIVLPSSGTISINAKEFDDGSTDDVTAVEDLQFYLNNDRTLTTYTVNCDSFDAQGVRGEYRSEFFFNVSDEAGNVSTCGVELLVQDNKEICGEVYKRCSGCVKLWYSGEVLEAQMQCDTMTSACYTAVLDETRRVSFCKDDDYLNGVTVKDLIQIKRHLLGLKPFEHPLQFIAADVNNSQSVSVGDISSLRKVILGRFADFSLWNQSSYKVFVESGDYKNKPLDSELVFPKGDSCPEFTDFVAVKIGDVAASLADTLNSIQTRGSVSMDLIREDRLEENMLGLYIENQITFSGAEITFHLNSDQKMECLSGQWEVGPNDWYQNGNMLKIAWVNPDQMETTMDPRTPVIYLKSEISSSEIGGEFVGFDQALNEYEGKFLSKKEVFPAVFLPNPVKQGEKTQIHWKRTAMIHEINLVDMNGRSYKLPIDNKGENHIEFSTSQLKKGLYFVRFNRELNVGKLIVY